MFLRKGVLKICSKCTGEHPCLRAISVKLLCNFIEITLRHECSPVNLLHIFRTPFLKNTSGWLLLYNLDAILEKENYSNTLLWMFKESFMKAIHKHCHLLIITNDPVSIKLKGFDIRNIAEEILLGINCQLKDMCVISARMQVKTSMLLQDS